MSHTVLVVDDEPFVRVTLASLRSWRDEGYDFRFEAGNGAQALELLREHPEIDVVLLDLAMPVLDGIGFLEALRDQLQGRLPSVAVLSAHDDFPLVRRAFTLGARDYLLKSEVDGDSLLALLQRMNLDPASPRIDSREKEFLADQWLRDALSGASTDWSALADTVGSWLMFPCLLWSIGIIDFEVVANRYGSEDLGRFGELFLRMVQQTVDKRGGGRAVSMSPELVAVVSRPGQETDLVGAEMKASLERYLSVKVSVSFSAPVAELAGLTSAWSDLNARRPATSRIVLQTRRYLRAHFATAGITLEQLAQRVGVSRNHLSFEFAKEMGQTITDYVASLRVEMACHLLATTSLKVYEIAEKVGYSNVEHFCRVFRKVSGTSPSRWASDESANISRDLSQ